jgi:membrane-associated phospholipid phosphatase
MPALSQQGYLLVIPFFLFMFLKGARKKNELGESFIASAFWTVLIACCAVYCAGWVEDTLKVSVARVRPCRALEGIRLITTCPKSYGMPSGHAISSFACALPLFYLTRQYLALPWRLYPLILASLIAFSRLYLGVHYPTDVLAGAVLGALIGLALSVLYQVIATKNIRPGKQ